MTFVIIVLAIIGFIVFKNQDSRYLKNQEPQYVRGEMVVIFKDFDLTENEIYNFLDEYEVELSKETVESFGSLRRLGTIAVKVPEGKEDEYIEILKKSPMVESVIYHWTVTAPL